MLQNCYNFGKKILFITIPSVLIFILFCEFTLFRFILPASDYPTCRMLMSSDDIYRYDNNAPYHEGVYRLGFPPEINAHYKINSDGWNANREYSEQRNNKKRIAVIGDSFVEAFQVDISRSFAEIIENELKKNVGGNVEVYRFGMSGIPLSQYLYMMRYVKEKYKPDIYIVNIAANDFLDSVYGYDNPNRTFLQFMFKDSRWIEMKPDPNIQLGVHDPKRRFLKRSAIARYFAYNLQLYSRLNALYYKLKGIDVNKAYEMNIKVDCAIANHGMIQSLCNYIFLQCKSLLFPDAKLLLIIPSNIGVIYEGKNPKTEKVYALIKIAEDAAGELSIPFLDLNEAFILDYKNNRQPFDFKCDGHWNERGHLIVGKAIAAFIQENKWIQEKDYGK